MPVLSARKSTLPAAMGVAIVLTYLLLSHPQTSVFQSIVDIASWLRGDGSPKPEVVTWPAWGYAWVVAWIPKFQLVMAMQACLGGFTLILLVRRLRVSMPRECALLAVLYVLAIPWHDMQVTLYPSGLAGSLALLGLLSLDAAANKADLRFAVLAGVLIGLAQNIRTEFVLMPLFIGVCIYALRRWRFVEIPSLKPLAICIATGLILQLPWAFFYHAETGRFSLTESNLGHVMYVSLGSDPHNPWGIVGNDQGAMQAVRELGYSFSSLSDQGDQVLRRLVWSKVKQHPLGVVRRTIQQLRNTIVAPFNWGEPKLDDAGKRDLDVLRQELKARIGVGINVGKLNEYRSDDSYPQARRNPAAISALLYQTVAVGLGSLVFLLGMTGICLVVARAKSMRQPLLLWLLASAALYKLFQDIFLYYQVSYLNNVYPMFLPFAAFSLVAVQDRLQRHRLAAVASGSRS